MTAAIDNMPAARAMNVADRRNLDGGRERKMAWGSQRNSLKRLKTDKRIQGNPSFFLWFSLSGLGLALLDLDKFGVNLEKRYSTHTI
jgi:hypothetical protein